MKILNEIPAPVEKGTLVAMDVEMYGMQSGKLHRPVGTFACLSICIDPKVVYQLYNEADVRAALKALDKGTWVFHNALFDLRQLSRYAIIRPRYIHDTMLVDQSMYGGYYLHFSLRDLVRRWLKERMKKDTREEFESADHMTGEMKRYAANDAVKTLRIARLQIKEFQDDPAFRAYKEIDEPMIFPILEMPGVLVDQDGWGRLVDEFAIKAKQLEEELGVNAFSSKKVLAAAAQHGIHIRDTRAETLKAYKDHPFIARLRETRMYRKAVSTYGRTWLEKNVEADGLVYSSYKIDGATTTCRMSSSSPNMQQIPARQLPEYRGLFPASKNCVILVADVSQQEPRILAWESRDEALIKAFTSGEDLHLYVARLIFNDPKMTKEDKRRDIGKTINLGTAYGLSEYGLATRLNITEQEAAQFLNQYFTRFRGVALWIDLKRSEAAKNGYIQTACGRRLYINPHDRSWQNNAINSPIQGGAADFTKMWVRKIWEKCHSHGVAFLVDRIVHDEIVMNVPKIKVREYREIVEEAFQETAKKLYSPIPFAMDMKTGTTWGCKKLAVLEEVEDEE